MKHFWRPSSSSLSWWSLPICWENLPFSTLAFIKFKCNPAREAVWNPFSTHLHYVCLFFSEALKFHYPFFYVFSLFPFVLWLAPISKFDATFFLLGKTSRFFFSLFFSLRAPRRKLILSLMRLRRVKGRNGDVGMLRK